MSVVRAKKHLGQHFLTDRAIAGRIVNSLQSNGRFENVLEVGPGMGILSDILLQDPGYQTWLIDLDIESIDYLAKQYPKLDDRLIHGDFLKLDFGALFHGPVAIIGNFPYNISSQILFKILEERERVVEVVGMFQKEVAERCAAKPGNKEYGILSVFLQAFYDVTYLFTVKAGAFNPPPKVTSAVFRLRPHLTKPVQAEDEKLFALVVRETFNHRRKTLRAIFKQSSLMATLSDEDFASIGIEGNARPETLDVKDFVALSNLVKSKQQNQLENSDD